MRLPIRVILALCCLMLPLIACGGGSGPAGAVDPAADVQTQTVDGLLIALEGPKEPKLLDTASFLITLTDAAGKPVEGADVYIELLMPSMPMGTNKPVASPEGPGKYRAQGVFDMTGDWHVTVHATVAGKDHVAQFISKVGEKK